MNIIKRAWQWLITKHEDTKVSEPLNDTITTEAPTTPATVAASVEPVAVTSSVTDGVQDFEKALEFVRDGIKKLGEEAESELIALAKKYL